MTPRLVRRLPWLMAAVVAAGLAATLPPSPAFAGCDPEDRIDRSTAAEARHKFEQAGFTNVRELHKGCDNYWHARATKDGWDSYVVLSPQGEVMREGD